MGDQMSDQEIEGYREAFIDMHWPGMTRAHSSGYWDQISRRERVDWVPLIQRWQWEVEMGREKWDRPGYRYVSSEEKDEKYEAHLRKLRKEARRRELREFDRRKQSVSANASKLQRPKQSVSANASSAWNLGGVWPNFGWIVIAAVVILGIFLLLNLL